MDIEAIVKKHLNAWRVSTVVSPESCIRAALTELAAEYDRKQALLLEAHCERVSSLQERIRQLEAERVLDDAAIISAMSIAGATDKEWKALTYESGAYDITKPTVFLQRLAKVLAAAPQPKKEGE